jgi:hypothetical protein
MIIHSQLATYGPNATGSIEQTGEPGSIAIADENIVFCTLLQFLSLLARTKPIVGKMAQADWTVNT